MFTGADNPVSRFMATNAEQQTMTLAMTAAGQLKIQNKDYTGVPPVEGKTARAMYRLGRHARLSGRWSEQDEQDHSHYYQCRLAGYFEQYEFKSVMNFDSQMRIIRFTEK